MKAKVLKIVNKICNNELCGCRGLAGNMEYVAELFSLKGISFSDIKVNEVPLHWQRQVVILYTVCETGEHRELFAGIGSDNKFYFRDSRDEDHYNYLIEV